MRLSLVGGAGLVGHHLALNLRSRGHDVQVVDSLMVNNLHSVTIGPERWTAMLRERLTLLDHAGVPVFRVDARDYHVLSPTLADFKPDIIIHLAAVAHIDRANKDPFHTFDHSLRTLENTLDTARALGSAVIYFSSSTVYGDFSQPVIDEDEELTPFGIYGNLKLAGERMALAYNQTYGMPLVIIRPQALYGARCVSGRVTQKFVERAYDGLSLIIHGGGGEKHDFTYIDDLVQGIRLVVESGKLERGFQRTYNLTGECATSLNDLAGIITERFPTKVEYSDPDPDKPSRGTMSCKRIRGELGYEPQFDIRKGMNAYMDYYQGLEYAGKVA